MIKREDCVCMTVFVEDNTYMCLFVTFSDQFMMHLIVCCIIHVQCLSTVSDRMILRKYVELVQLTLAYTTFRDLKQILEMILRGRKLIIHVEKKERSLHLHTHSDFFPQFCFVL